MYDNFIISIIILLIIYTDGTKNPVYKKENVYFYFVLHIVILKVIIFAIQSDLFITMHQFTFLLIYITIRTKVRVYIYF